MERHPTRLYHSVDHLYTWLPAALPARLLSYRSNQRALPGSGRCLHLIPLRMEPGARRGIELERIGIPEDGGLHQPAVGVSQRRLGVVGNKGMGLPLDGCDFSPYGNGFSGPSHSCRLFKQPTI